MFSALGDIISALEDTINAWGDDYIKDGGTGKVWLLCSFYHELLCNLIKTDVTKFAILYHRAMKLGVQALRGYLGLKYEYKVHILPNTKLGTANDHCKNYIKVRSPFIRHL